jgi:hypothetical protein
MEPISREYIRGYTKAIMDIKEQMVSTSVDLQYHKKRFTPKSIEYFFKLYLENRMMLREGIGFIRYNTLTNELEWYRGEEK